MGKYLDFIVSDSDIEHGENVFFFLQFFYFLLTNLDWFDIYTTVKNIEKPIVTDLNRTIIIHVLV